MLAPLGVRLVLGARRLDRVERLAAELRDAHRTESLVLAIDVRDAAACEAFVGAALGRFGRIDVLVNNAGLARGRQPVAEGIESEWDEMIDTNVKGLLHMSRLVLPGMIERDAGHVVNLGSV